MLLAHTIKGTDYLANMHLSYDHFIETCTPWMLPLTFDTLLIGCNLKFINKLNLNRFMYILCFLYNE